MIAFEGCMKKTNLLARPPAILMVLALLLAVFEPTLAQEAPAPHKSPRVPVNSQPLPGSAAAVMQSREAEGPATIIDGEHLRIGAVDLRLFGIVPPQLSASFGPQARAALDEIAQGQNIDCRVRDRDHDGRFLATCTTADGKTDLALELLRRGLAVTARGSLQPTELAASYEAAEEAAQTKKLGLWSVTVPAPASVPVPSATVVANASPAPPELKNDEKPEEKPPAPPTVMSITDQAVDKKVNKTTGTAAPSPSVTPVAAQVPAPKITAETTDENADPSGFFARYQLLFTGLVMLMTAFGIMAVLALQRRRDQRDEMKAIAAALRGELLAARAVYQARHKIWAESDDRGANWPRIRATLYQAYVGRLGWLGAVLARQIASIYGQAGDYASYFNSGAAVETQAGMAARRQALQTLLHHIEDVLPKLAVIEQSGARPKGEAVAQPRDFIAASPTAVPQQNVSAGFSLAPLRDTIRKLIDRRPAPPLPPIVLEEPSDYTSLIEQDMARMAYDEPPSPPSNVTKIRTRS
jgi:endonuclease YncB( thermonuclease family)